MKTFVQLSGNYDIITCLNDTLVINTCGFENGFEYEDLDDQAMIRIYQKTYQLQTSTYF